MCVVFNFLIFNSFFFVSINYSELTAFGGLSGGFDPVHALTD